MARTLNGGCTGRAARIERRDEAERISERQHEFSRRWFSALDKLREIDPGWEAWYDSRSEQTCGEMLGPIEERIHNLTVLQSGVQ